MTHGIRIHLLLYVQSSLRDVLLRSKFFVILQFLGNVLCDILDEVNFSCLILHTSYFSLSLSELDRRIDWIDVVVIVEIELLVVTRAGNFSSPNPCCPYQFQLQIIFF